MADNDMLVALEVGQLEVGWHSDKTVSLCVTSPDHQTVIGSAEFYLIRRVDDVVKEYWRSLIQVRDSRHLTPDMPASICHG